MNPQNDPEPGPVVPNASHAPADHQVVRTSTRVLLDSSTALTCDACGAAISRGSKYKCVTVEEGRGRVTDLPFCNDRCRSTVL
jgi:hypothetical protein